MAAQTYVWMKTKNPFTFGERLCYTNTIEFEKGYLKDIERGKRSYGKEQL
jgi:hypothetical protein